MVKCCQNEINLKSSFSNPEIMPATLSRITMGSSKQDQGYLEAVICKMANFRVLSHTKKKSKTIHQVQTDHSC